MGCRISENYILIPNPVIIHHMISSYYATTGIMPVKIYLLRDPYLYKGSKLNFFFKMKILFLFISQKYLPALFLFQVNFSALIVSQIYNQFR